MTTYNLDILEHCHLSITNYSLKNIILANRDEIISIDFMSYSIHIIMT